MTLTAKQMFNNSAYLCYSTYSKNIDVSNTDFQLVGCKKERLHQNNKNRLDSPPSALANIQIELSCFMMYKSKFLLLF